MPDLLTELTARGMVHHATPGLAERLARGAITGYVGFDPTAESLHVGNLVPVMGLAWLQRLGGRPIAMVGGGTGLVGDPSGKRTERPMLSPDQVRANAAAIRVQLERFLDFDGPNPARMLDNTDWLAGLKLLEFLRDTGKHFTVSYMMQKEAVKSRLDAGISFTEFSYMLVQAYDFSHLYRTAGCELQMGGSDQWGNITAGIELIARRDGGSAHGLVFPLLTTGGGAKFGKSEDGNVWLDPARTSPYQFYQFWLNCDDRDVERLLHTFSLRPLAEISALMKVQHRDPGKRAAQRDLADEMTTRVHGGAIARRVIDASAALFGSADLRSLDLDTLRIVGAEVTTVGVARAELAAGLSVTEMLVRCGLASSKADARRGIQGGGFSVNGERIETPDRSLLTSDLLAGRYIALQKGRRQYAFIEAT